MQFPIYDDATLSSQFDLEIFQFLIFIAPVFCFQLTDIRSVDFI